ncbi:MAG: FAD-dependent oxidoreductase [Planctomycetota bacterium]
MDAFRTVVPVAHHESADTKSADPFAADVPSRMFNAAQWPSLVALYDELGVDYEPVDASQSFSVAGRGKQAESFLKLDLAHLPQFTLQILSARVRKIMSDARRLMKDGRADLDNDNAAGLTLREYLINNRYSDEFVFDFLYPTLSSTVCTCSFIALDSYPADVVLKCLRNLNIDRGLLRTTHGSIDVVERLTKKLDDLKTGCTVSAINRTHGRVSVTTSAGTFEFDHAIVATQANTARNLVGDLTDQEQRILSSVRYEDIHVSVHDDVGMMPVNTNDWSTFNMLSTNDRRSASCTVWLNRFHSGWQIDQDYFQTISPGIPVEADDAIASFKMQRPVVDVSTLGNLEELNRLHDDPSRRIWFCGSWASYGVPLLETGVVSATDIAGRIAGHSRTTETQATR